jgi:hypothetical protein
MRPSPRELLVALVTPHAYPRAQRLADELEAIGYRVIIVDVPAKARRALDADACVIVLTPEEWRDPAIGEVMRSRPQVIVPLLAAPMDLPRAAWSADPVSMRGSPAQVAESIADAIDMATGAGQLGAARSGRRGGDSPAGPRRGGYEDGPPYGPPDPFYGPMAERGSYPGSVSVASRSLPQKAAKPPMALRVTSIVIAVIVALGVGYYADRHFLHASVVDTMTPYSANVPGPGCDKGGGTWKLPTDVSGYTTTCQATGMLLSQNNNYKKAAEVFFDGTSQQNLPANYRLQVTAEITQGDKNVEVGLVAHRQTPYGGNYFLASEDSLWEADRLSSDNVTDTVLRLGFLSQGLKKYTLGVTVEGPTMTFSINGTQIASVTDSTFTSTPAVSLALIDPLATQPIAALFSQFSIAPLPAPSLSTSSALATATAQAAAANATYRATTPGPGCDKGGAQWATPAVLGQASGATLTCTSSGLKIVSPQTTSQGDVFIGGPAYYGPTGVLPANYQVSVTATLSDTNAIAGIATRDTESSAYLYLVSAGSWAIFEVPSSGPFRTLASQNDATLAAGTPLTIAITEHGSSHTLAVNGKTLATVSDSSIVPGQNYENVMIASVGSSAGSSTVTFKDFVFTPQA